MTPERVPIAVPLPNRPQQSMLSGLGVAGAVLAAVVVTFTLASGIIAYTLTSEDPLSPSTGTLVLGSLRTDVARTPIVLRDPGSGGRHALATAGVARAAGGFRGAEGTLSAPAQNTARRAGNAQQGGGGADAGAATAPTAQPGDISVPPRKPGVGTLSGTSHGLGATTAALTIRLRAITDSLAALVKPIAQDPGVALRATLGATTGALARVLGPRTVG
jgi:hypothetical protein